MNTSLFIGIISIITGWLIFFKYPRVYGVQIPNGVGLVVILIGFYCLIISLVDKARSSEDQSNVKNATYVICVKCKMPFYRHIITDGKCPECGGDLENLDGFYERHPEEKGAKEDSGDNP